MHRLRPGCVFACRQREMSTGPNNDTLSGTYDQKFADARAAAPSKNQSAADMDLLTAEGFEEGQIEKVRDTRWAVRTATADRRARRRREGMGKASQ